MSQGQFQGGNENRVNTVAKPRRMKIGFLDIRSLETLIRTLSAVLVH